MEVDALEIQLAVVDVEVPPLAGALVCVENIIPHFFVVVAGGIAVIILSLAEDFIITLFESNNPDT